MRLREKLKTRLYEKDFVTKKAWWGEGETILTNETIKAKPIIVRKALAIEHVMKNMPIELMEYELIVGNPTMSSIGFGKIFPEFALPEEEEEAKKYGFSSMSTFGHVPIRYDRVVEQGLSGVRKDVLYYQKQMRETDFSQEKEDFYQSLLICLDAIKLLADRYVCLLEDAAHLESDTQRKEELLEMAKVCRNVPENPARSFHEALQSTYFIYTVFQSCAEWIPIGRPDQYLYPYYEKDINEGTLTKEKAEDLVASWLVKFNERVHLYPEQWEAHHRCIEDDQYNGLIPGMPRGWGNEEDFFYGTSSNNWLTNMILGGVKPDGTDGTNELTYILFYECAYLEVVTPVVSIRAGKDTPDKLLRMYADIVRSGLSEPAIYNDEAFVDGLIKLGVSPEDARDYSNDGCWEVVIPGRTNLRFSHIYILQLMEYLFQDGNSLIRNRKECNDVPDLDSYKTYDDFFNALLNLLRREVEQDVQLRIHSIAHRAKIAPDPLMSLFTDDCIKLGKEYSIGGARYSIHGLLLTGVSNTVDSLASIKKLVFEEGKYTLREFAEAMRTNYAGKEIMRQEVLNRVPKFGNDQPYVDNIASELLGKFSDIIDEVSNKYKSEKQYLVAGIGTFQFALKFGNMIGASADGRLAQETLASNYSPFHGVDVSGPTASIRSITTPNLLPYVMGSPLDLEINPNEIIGEEGLNRMVGLIKAFKELGGLMLTLTGVSKEKLLDAQKNPEKYRSLRVRLGGFSAYFTMLTKEMQDSIIQRTSHTF